MTKISPRDLQSEDVVPKTQAVDEEEEEKSSSENENDIDNYDPDPALIKPQKSSAEKRSSYPSIDEDSDIKKPKIEVENVDFSQYKKGVNPKTHTFDPNKDQFRGGKKSKAKQRYKNSGKFGGKSITYKK